MVEPKKALNIDELEQVGSALDKLPNELSLLISELAGGSPGMLVTGDGPLPRAMLVPALMVMPLVLGSVLMTCIEPLVKSQLPPQTSGAGEPAPTIGTSL